MNQILAKKNSNNIYILIKLNYFIDYKFSFYLIYLMELFKIINNIINEFYWKKILKKKFNKNE